MAGTLITVPAFAGARDGVQHFFGTRHQATGVDSSGGSVTPGVPIGQDAAGGDRRSKNGPVEPAKRLVVVVSVRQVHGTDALVLDRPLEAGETFAGGWDALMTNQSGVLLTIRTADCVPVLVHDPLRRVVAAVHAGWRGTVAGVVPKTLSLMRQRFGSEPASLQIGIGPSVGPCCYEVAPDVAEPFRRAYGEDVVIDGRLDLWTSAERALREAGCDEVERTDLCTFCHPELFFSHRRDRGLTGRQGIVAYIT